MSIQFNRTRFNAASIEELEQDADYIELHTRTYDENETDITACFSIALDDLTT
jgi:hypothetical protein